MPKQDFSDKYNTRLSKEEESQFRDAMASYQLEKEARHQTELNDPSFRDTRSLDQFIHDETNDYDMRGAFQKGIKQGENFHWDDEFKKPNHETFSTGSKYHGVDGYKGGIWKDGNYTVGPTTRAMYSDEELEKYRQEVEPNAQFIFDPSVHKNGYSGKEDLPLEEPLIGPDTLIGMGTGFVRNMGISALNKMSGLASKVFSQKLNPTTATKIYNGLLGASGSLVGDKVQDAAVDYVKGGLADYYGQKPQTYVLGGGSGLVDLGNGRFKETLPDGTTVQYSGIAPEDMIAAQVDVRNNVPVDNSLILDTAIGVARALTGDISRHKPDTRMMREPQAATGPRG